MHQHVIKGCAFIPCQYRVGDAPLAGEIEAEIRRWNDLDEGVGLVRDQARSTGNDHHIHRRSAQGIAEGDGGIDGKSTRIGDTRQQVVDVEQAVPGTGSQCVATDKGDHHSNSDAIRKNIQFVEIGWPSTVDDHRCRTVLGSCHIEVCGVVADPHRPALNLNSGVESHMRCDRIPGDA